MARCIWIEVEGPFFCRHLLIAKQVGAISNSSMSGFGVPSGRSHRTVPSSLRRLQLLLFPARPRAAQGLRGAEHAARKARRRARATLRRARLERERECCCFKVSIYLDTGPVDCLPQILSFCVSSRSRSAGATRSKTPSRGEERMWPKPLAEPLQCESML